MRKKHFLAVICVCCCVLFFAACENTYNTDDKPAFNNNFASTNPINKMVDQEITLDNASTTMKIVNLFYPNNFFVSLKNAAYTFRNSHKPFVADVNSEKEVTITQNSKSKALQPGNMFNAEISEDMVARYRIKYNNQPIKYYSCVEKDLSGNYDCYMSLTDFCLMLDIDYNIDNDLKISLDTTKPFTISFSELKDNGFDNDIDSIYVKNITKNKELYSKNADTTYSMASMSKMMTYAVVKDAIKDNKISESDVATFHRRSQEISESTDAEIDCKDGDKITVEELLHGMLIPSSNECAVALAEHVAGSEDEFIKLMQNKANELNLKSAKFYNASGLPIYPKTKATTPSENSMCAKDIETLAEYILKTYPEITDITSKKEYEIKSLNEKITNSNPLLFDFEGTTGLKTGTTFIAGKCLTALVHINDQDYLIVLQGMAYGDSRPRKAQILAKCCYTDANS